MLAQNISLLKKFREKKHINKKTFIAVLMHSANYLMTFKCMLIRGLRVSEKYEDSSV